MVQEGNKKYVRMFTVFPFMCFVNSQIWLNWLTNDCHLGYIKNLIFFFFFGLHHKIDKKELEQDIFL
jgi:hypothetical protein